MSEKIISILIHLKAFRSSYYQYEIRKYSQLDVNETFPLQYKTIFSCSDSEQLYAFNNTRVVDRDRWHVVENSRFEYLDTEVSVQ